MPTRKPKRVAAAARHLASRPLLNSLEDLVFYAIDKASPFNLALQSTTDSIAKIAPLKFAELMIDKLGLSIMWTVLNAGLPNVGGKAVAPAAASKCKTAGDVYAEAKKTTGGS